MSLMRYLALDLGAKRTGLAVGSDQTKLASPVGVVVASGVEDRWRRIVKAVEEHGPDELILGLPLNMDGTEGPPAKEVRALAAELTRHLGLKVHLVDERLTSFEADNQMAGTGMTHGQKKAVRDALAAAAILRDFLFAKSDPDENRSGPGEK